MKNYHLCKEDYDTIKDSVSMQNVVSFYGYPVDQKGRCVCPFHNDKHPSMKIYPHNKGYYCFACGSGGDVITFVGKLYGLGNEDAGKKLIQDFSLPVQTEGLSYRQIREREKRIRKRKAYDDFVKQAKQILTTYRILLCEASRNYASMHFDEAMQELSIVEYRLECLDKYPQEYYADKKAVKKIGEIRERIACWDR